MEFESPIDLHYSQTICRCLCAGGAFESPIDLHYSQTGVGSFFSGIWFESPIDLHYSQTHPRFSYRPQQV